jgi:NAD(P)-dependent dehydrogenase (short-subunit alcohol dehydrogenase family)
MQTVTNDRKEARMGAWSVQDMPDQSGRVVVITGANSGIGYESAVALAAKGAQVVMACRSMDKAERARQALLMRVPNASLSILQLDLGTLKSIHQFAGAFHQRYERLDILMNNAGIMAPPYAVTEDGFESQTGTNHLGHFALTGLLLPKLLQTPKSRVVTVSSYANLFGWINFNDLQSKKQYIGWLAYCQSKLANLLFARHLQHKLAAAEAGVISVAVHPGHVVTNLQTHPANLLDAIMLRLANWTMGMPVEVGARYQLYAATAPEVQGGEFYGPRYLIRGEVARAGLTRRARDQQSAARLWQLSEQLTGVRYDEIVQAAPVKAGIY